MSEEASDQLADMRHAYNRPASEDRTQGQKACRRWMNRDIKGFMTWKSQLEAKAGPRGTTAPAEKGKDCPTCGQYVPEEKNELLENLLHDQITEDRRRERERNAQLAARPDAAQVGAVRQAALRAALWRERQLLRRIAELERGGDETENEDKLWRHFSDFFYNEVRVENAEHAIHLEPGKIIDSLEHALKLLEGEREPWLREQVEKLEREKNASAGLRAGKSHP